MSKVDMSFGLVEPTPRAFTVGPMFPKINRQAAKQAVAAVREKQKKRRERLALQAELKKAGSFKEAVKIVKKKKK